MGKGMAVPSLVLAVRVDCLWDASYTGLMKLLLRVAGWTLLLSACHREPKRVLTKSDLEEARALRFEPFGSLEKVHRKLGAPSRIEQNRSVWTAREGSVCWDLTIISGGSNALFWLDRRSCERGL